MRVKGLKSRFTRFIYLFIQSILSSISGLFVHFYRRLFNNEVTLIAKYPNDAVA